MKPLIGLLMIIAGIVLGIYVGGYLMLFKGVLQIIEQIQAEQLIAAKVAWGVVKILFAGAVGSACAYVLIIPGRVLIND